MELAASSPLSVLRRLVYHGLAELPLAAMVILMAASLNQAGWVPDSSPLVNALVVGLLVGILLAVSAFSGWFAAGYHFLLAFLLVSAWIGKIFPTLDWVLCQPAFAVLDYLNIRLLTYIDRLLNWFTTLAAGNNVQDNGLFQLLIGLLAWASSAWLAWAIFRRRRSFDGLLPAGLLMGVNVYLSGQSVDWLWVFISCAILVATRSCLVGLQQSWERRGIDYPDELGWSWAGAACGLALVILIAARLAPLFGSPEGWKTLADWYWEGQRNLEDTASRLFGDVTPPRAEAGPEGTPATGEMPAPLAQSPQMGLIGAAPSQSRALVMWVKTSDPPPPAPEPGIPEEPLGIGSIHYWRSGVFGRYTGAGWEGLEVLDMPSSPLDNAQPAGGAPGRYTLVQEFEIVARHAEALFGASQPVQVSGEGDVRLRFTEPDSTPLVYGQADRYTVQSWVTHVTDLELRAAETIYPPEIAATFLQLPSGLPQRVRDLARRVVGEAATPYDKAVRIQDYLRQSYKYDLGVPLPPQGRDVVDYFLFDSPGGFCSYYASAMAVMLRTQGVAARVASGYATGRYDYERGAYGVVQSNSHAWVEVYFSRYGWVEFEPTVAFERIRYETAGAAAEAGGEPLPPRPQPLIPLWQGITLAAVAILTPLALAAFLYRRRTRQLRAGLADTPARQAERLYLRLRRWLGWIGLSAPASSTPAEYLAASVPVLTGRGELSAALAQATALYQQAVYSPRPPSYEEVNQAAQMAARSWVQWLGLLFARLFYRLLRTRP